jgi:hypothetical protein
VASFTPRHPFPRHVLIWIAGWSTALESCSPDSPAEALSRVHSISSELVHCVVVVSTSSHFDNTGEWCSKCQFLTSKVTIEKAGLASVW